MLEGLSEPLYRALKTQGYTQATPIQAQSIPALLMGRDLCGIAQTGTGKTAAFALPILQKLSSTPGTGLRALILAPTRELAIQVDAMFGIYGQFLPEIRHAVVYGGMKPRAQKRALAEGVEILVATPGRLLDLCGHGFVSLQHIEILVLDEADRMLDLGFLEDVRKLLKLLPSPRQNVLFSATLPPEIQALTARILRNPVRVSVAPASTVAPHITQYLYPVAQAEKRALLVKLLSAPTVLRTLVFVRTRQKADRLREQLRTAGFQAEALHGDLPQVERNRVLHGFKTGSLRILVATDVAARGLDIEAVSHVINVDMPEVPETYVHRIGRTARAGASGIAISLCDPSEIRLLRSIEALIGKGIIDGPPLS